MHSTNLRASLPNRLIPGHSRWLSSLAEVRAYEPCLVSSLYLPMPMTECALLLYVQVQDRVEASILRCSVTARSVEIDQVTHRKQQLPIRSWKILGNQSEGTCQMPLKKAAGSEKK